MSPSLLQLAAGSCYLSQSEKKITVCKVEQVYKMTTQNGPGWRKLSFWVKIVVILWICSALQTVISVSAWVNDVIQKPTEEK